MRNKFPLILSVALLFTELQQVQTCSQLFFDQRDGLKDRALTGSSILYVTSVNNSGNCFLACYKNCQCLSFNVCGTKCELNAVNRFLKPEAIKETGICVYYDKPLDEMYCKRCMQCKNSGKCHTNQWTRTHECRCSLQYSGAECKIQNSFADSFNKHFGIGTSGLFLLTGSFYFEEAKNACWAFNATLATTDEVAQLAIDDGRGHCQRGWTKEGSLGYPVFNGSCHAGSTRIGYYSYNCCPDRKVTKSPTWCIKRGLDYCKPNWYAFGSNCFMFNNEEKVTWNEAKEKCHANNGRLAKFATCYVGKFMNKICPECLSMFIGVQKVGETWLWVTEHNNASVASTLWSPGEPQGVGQCAEWNAQLNSLKVVPCTARRGYVCITGMF